MELATILFSAVLAVLAASLLRCALRLLASARRRLPLPPGTLGWPYLGETFQLYSQDPNIFFAKKQSRSGQKKNLINKKTALALNSQHARKLPELGFSRFLKFFFFGDFLRNFGRYGSIFKTHILGCPCVMISSPEAAKFVLVTKSDLFKPTFPASKERMLGKQAIFFHQGDYHGKLRKLVLRAFMPEAIRSRVPDIESIAVDSLQSWEGRLVNTFQEMKTVSFFFFRILRFSGSPFAASSILFGAKGRREKKMGFLRFFHENRAIQSSQILKKEFPQINKLLFGIITVNEQ